MSRRCYLIYSERKIERLLYRRYINKITFRFLPSITSELSQDYRSIYTPQKQQEKLLPLLMEKDTPDAKQVQAELHATQSKLKAVQKINEELRAEANEAKKAGLGTRPLMARLMRTARASQGTLVKLVKAIADYQLTHDEKAYLHSLAESND